ncbi:MAG: radical SAM protein, partial [Bdellovibrionia bacterium]
RVVAGGAHVSALSTESLLESALDIVVQGEGDRTFAEIMDGGALKDIKGIFYRQDGEILKTAPRPFLENLDELPMPAWHLYNSRNYKYKISRLLARRRPLAMAEFSRGCVYKCDFCASKNTMAWGYRKKSPERCAEEVKLMYRHGYREFALADDIFTSDNDWASAVCEEIIKTGIDMPWTCTNGIRVESANKELFKTMRKAGCYRVSFGFESGSDEVLKAFGKGGRASLQKGREAVAMAREAGLDACGFFMLGLSPDTPATMNETIEFARGLPLDMMKFGIAIAFPGTEMFKKYREQGMVRSYNWDDYFIYSTKPLFAHRGLSFEEVQRAMATAYKRAILQNPGFIKRRLWRGIKTGEFFWDAYYFLKFFKAPPINAETHGAVYFAQERWPEYDFKTMPMTFYQVRSSNNRWSEAQLEGISI